MNLGFKQHYWLQFANTCTDLTLGWTNMDEVKGLELGTRLVVSLCNKVILNDRLTSVRRQGNASLLERTVLCCFKGTLDHCCFNLRCSCKSCFDLNLLWFRFGFNVRKLQWMQSFINGLGPRYSNNLWTGFAKKIYFSGTASVPIRERLWIDHILIFNWFNKFWVKF